VKRDLPKAPDEVGKKRFIKKRGKGKGARFSVPEKRAGNMKVKAGAQSSFWGSKWEILTEYNKKSKIGGGEGYKLIY